MSRARVSADVPGGICAGHARRLGLSSQEDAVAAIGEKVWVVLTREEFRKLYLQLGTTQGHDDPVVVSGTLQWLSYRRVPCASISGFCQTLGSIKCT